MDIKNTITEMLNKMEDFKKQITNEISKIPDDPKIKRISEKPYIFILNSKDLENNWGPEYYDSKIQAQTIIDLITKRNDLNSIQRMLTEIVEKGSYKTDSYNKMYFNNQVRDLD
jgi:tRNA U34 5-carboxymethylaminomethyl modifying GTPase MnmE/TrmE